MRTGRFLVLAILLTLALLPSAPPAALAVGTTCLDPVRVVGVAGPPQAVAVADFNNDGRRDLAAVSDDGWVTVRLGQPDGGFGPDIGFDLGGSLAWITALDVTSDGDVDLFAVASNGSFATRRGQGDGTFVPHSSGGGGMSGHIVVNVIGDPAPDALWFVELPTARLQVSVNGGGLFPVFPLPDYDAGTDPHRMAAGDLNGDGATDIVVVNRTSPGAINVLLNNGAGAFPSLAAYPVQPMPGALAVGDVNRDGRLDVVVGEDGLDGVTLRLGNGAGALGPAANIPSTRPTIAGEATAVALGDFNRDGWPDIASASTAGLSLLTSDGAGGFAAPTSLLNGDIAAVIAVDVNVDTWDDLVLADRSRNELVILTSCASNQPPALSAPSTQTTAEDTARNFSAANGSQITVTDPDAGSGPVRVALAATNGMLTLGTTAGLTFLLGDGVTDPATAFTGSVTAVNAALNGLRFDPEPNFSGSATLSVTVNDLGSTGNGAAQEVTTVIAITVQATNDPPVAVGDAYTLTGSTLTVPAPGVLANDTDVESPTLTAQVVRSPASASLTLGPDGSFTFTPAAGYSGSDSFTYRTDDGSGGTAEATVQITGAAGACLPRPRVQPRSQATNGRLLVQIEATPLNGAANNLLRELRFGQLQNARVTLNGQTVASGQTVSVPPNTVATDLIVERVTAGQATTVPLTIVDGCGAWTTFVGAGSGVQLTPAGAAP